jgi:D-alanine-D-alanine ligase
MQKLFPITSLPVFSKTRIRTPRNIQTFTLSDNMPSGDALSSGPIRLLIIAGGPSAEHAVSMMSATNILGALSHSKKFRPLLIVLTKQGRWLSEGESMKALAAGIANYGGTVRPVIPFSELCDVVFSLLDGWEGGAGAIQGILELEGIPYLGGGIIATVLTRDKIVAKQILAAHGIPMTRYVAFTREDYVENVDKIIKQASEFSLPLFVKPANLGSALGVLIEEGVKKPRELEVAIMGNHTLHPSPVGEIVYDGEWNDHETKYKTQPHYVIPANIPQHIGEKITAYALQTYRLLDCTGYGRVDFFMDRRTEQIYFNEASCSPGFTSKSVYPQLMAGAGYELLDLIENLVKFALERHQKKEYAGELPQDGVAA